MNKQNILYNINGCIKYNDLAGVLSWINRSKESMKSEEFIVLSTQTLELLSHLKSDNQVRNNIGMSIVELIATSDKELALHYRRKFDSLFNDAMLDKERKESEIRHNEELIKQSLEAEQTKIRIQAEELEEKAKKERRLISEQAALEQRLNRMKDYQRRWLEQRDKANYQIAYSLLEYFKIPIPKNDNNSLFPKLRKFLIDIGILRTHEDRVVRRAENYLLYLHGKREILRKFYTLHEVSKKGENFVLKYRKRITHCWRCKTGLSDLDNIECEKCRWLLCECGACGCAYRRS